MEQNNRDVSLLQLLRRPAFCVENGVITRLNEEAAAYLLEVGTEVRQLIRIGIEDYECFTSGCLYLTLQLGNQTLAACVVTDEQAHIFILEQQEDLAQLRSFALAARELREPLAGMMAAADQLLPTAAAGDDPQAKRHAAQMNRRLFQMLRLVGNMSDAAQYAFGGPERMETVNIAAFLDELFQRAAELSEKAGISLRYTGLPQDIFTLADPDRLERAIYNLLSNAMKACSDCGMIDVKITRRRDVIIVSITDNGRGIQSDMLGNVYSRFLRSPSLMDGQSGLGLGMVLVKSTAALHGGVVLIDQPAGQGTRVSMSIAVRKEKSTIVRSPVLRVDYAGERDHGLLELADVLPAELYGTDQIN